MTVSTRILRLSILLLVASFCPNLILSSQRGSLAGDSLYDAVLDRLFPSVGQGVVAPNSRNIVLKFGGTYIDTEMQVLIHSVDSKDEYEVWRIPSGSPSVFQKLVKLGVARKSLDPAALASSIVIEHRLIKPNEEVARLVNELTSQDFPLSVDDGMTADGISYSLYINSTSKHTRIELIGPRAPWSRHPLIKWMAAVRAALENELDSQKN